MYFLLNALRATSSPREKRACNKGISKCSKAPPRPACALRSPSPCLPRWAEQMLKALSMHCTLLKCSTFDKITHGQILMLLMLVPMNTVEHEWLDARVTVWVRTDPSALLQHRISEQNTAAPPARNKTKGKGWSIQT